MRLHEQVKQQARIIAVYEEHLSSINAYLSSEKFYIDTTVQVSDIGQRLIELRLAVWKAED